MASFESITIYHCICTQLILASTHPLAQFPTRKGDGSYICTTTTGTIPSPDESCHLADDSVSTDSDPVVLKLEDGFEKRYVLKCSRCDLTIGYQLDWSQFEQISPDHRKTGRREDVVYLLPGSLSMTEQMVEGVGPDGVSAAVSS